jgi:hypothetical protein
MLYCTNADPEDKLPRRLSAPAPVALPRGLFWGKIKVDVLSFCVVRGKFNFDGAKRLYAGQTIVAD